MTKDQIKPKGNKGIGTLWDVLPATLIQTKVSLLRVFLIPQSHAEVSLRARHHKQIERKRWQNRQDWQHPAPHSLSICSPPLDFTPSQVRCTVSWSAKGDQSKGWEVWSGGVWCCSMNCSDHKDKCRGYHRDSRQIEYSSFLPFYVLW